MSEREEPLLESWKEIAVYLKRSVRTCRRWEAELSLPIHRLDGTPRARVFAYPAELDRWISEKLHHIEAEEPRSGPLALLKKRRLFLGVGGAALAIALGGATVFIRPPSFLAPVPVPGQNPVLIILPFENASGDKTLEDWRIALPDLLVNDLRQSRYLNVVRLRRVFLWLRDKKLADASRISPDEAAAIAKAYQADFIATGKIEKAGDRIAVELSLRPDETPGGPPRVLRRVVRNEQALLNEADSLSKDIKQACGLSRRQLATDIDEGVRRIATASPEAMKLYARADLPAQGGPLAETGPAVEKALAIDPGFALAHDLMVASYGLEFVEDHIRSYEQTLSLADRLSERERLLLQANFYHFYRYQGGFTRLPETGVPASTIERLKPKTRAEVLPILERLADLYPDFYSDSIHLTNLVRIYQEAEDWDKAIAVLEKVAPSTATRMPANTQTLIRCYLARGQVGKAEEALAMLEKANPGRGSLNSDRAGIALRKRQYDRALEEIEKQYRERDKSIPPAYQYHSTRGYVLWLADDLSGAEKTYRSAAGNADATDEEQRAMDLSVLLLSQGKIGLAIDEAKKGLAFAEGNKEFARRGHGRDFHHLLAYLLRASGRLPEALQESEEACRDYQQPDVPPGLAVTLLHLRALVMLDLKLADAFERTLDEIRVYCEAEKCPKLMRAYHHLRGLRELRQNNGYKALAELERALALSMRRTAQSDPSRILFDLADAHISLGNRWAAVVDLEEIAAPEPRASFSGDVYALSFYRKAKIYEEIMKQATFRPDPQSRAKAIEGYKKFLSLWGDADPLFAAQVSDARQRLAALGEN